MGGNGAAGLAITQCMGVSLGVVRGDWAACRPCYGSVVAT